MQKAFAFYLLPFALLMAACRFNPNTQGPGEASLQGEWHQDSVPMQKKLLNYSLYHFKFSCDSFYVSVRSFTKAATDADTCIENGTWTEYAKGDYYQKSDTLHLKGLFCNANYTLKEPAGCFRSGVFEDEFKVKKIADSLIQFSPTSSVIPVQLRLIKRTTCTPKPL